MIKICYRPWLLTALALLSLTMAQGGTTAQTDLASITVTPLVHQGSTPAWQTIYDYSGGALPPGTFLHCVGKWVDPLMRQDQSGVTFSFPDLPDSPDNSQYLQIALGYNRPLANYPTRTTISYTSFFNQKVSNGDWSPFTIVISNNDSAPLFGGLTNIPANSPLQLVGNNTLVLTMVGNGQNTVTLNGQDATDLFGARGKLEKKKPGAAVTAMLANRVVLCNHVTQFPHNKGDWFAVHAFKVEQLRPPLEDSSIAAVDLTVPGRDPVTVTIEVVDATNNSRGYVLRDATVSPGQYRLYWDGIDQKSLHPVDNAWIGAGSYTFRLTTGKINMQYIGDINNSAPKYTTLSYGMVNCTALMITPPGTTAKAGGSLKWKDENNPNDTRKQDTTDSLQTIGTAYGAEKGQWILSDGTCISTYAGDGQMQNARAVAMTPPDPSAPTDLEKQFYFVSQNIKGGDAVISGCVGVDRDEKLALRSEGQKDQRKILTSPDWNRTKPAFVPYQVKIGQIPGGATLGPQHDLFFEMGGRGGTGGSGLKADWMIRNVRLYEEGSPDPGPMTFNPSQFSVRGSKKGDSSATAPLTQVSETAPPVPTPAKKTPKPAAIPAGTVTVADNGHTVCLKDAPSVNYPIDYNVTPHTILAFDLDVVDRSHTGKDNGIGLSPDSGSDNKGTSSHLFNFLGGKGSSGIKDPSAGAYTYPTYQPNTLYTDSVPLPPPAPVQNRKSDSEMRFLWQPGFYGLKISENGKFLFACNNADNRLEVYDISTDGHAVAKIPIDYPMFVTLAPEGAAGARQGTRFVYVDSPNAGLVRIAWNVSDNTFGKPETITPASEFAYPRGVVYDAAVSRIFICDTFNLDRSKEANQIVVIDPNTGKILSRFGKQGGVNPSTGGQIDDKTFTCPLTIDADSKGAVWVNDLYSCEVRKYDFDPASNDLKLERRVLGCGYTNCSHFFWTPDAPPTQVWTCADYFVRTEADFGTDGRFTNQRTTSATYHATESAGRPFPHFCKVGDHIYATYASQNLVSEQVGDGWVTRFGFGGNHGFAKETAGDAEDVARLHGLLAAPGQPPTDLDKAIAASGDPDWATRPWAWSDLNGDGKMEYTKDNPEFKIAFNSNISLDGKMASTCFRSSDGAFVCPCNERTDGTHSLLVLPPQTVNGKPSYDWKNAKIIPCAPGTRISDVLAQDGRFYVLRGTRLGGESHIECYDESGKLLWTREHTSEDLQSLQSLGDGMFTIMDRNFFSVGPVTIRTKDGDLVSQVMCQDAGDTWANGALRSDADTGYVGMVQVYKFTGLSTVKSAAATVKLSAAGH